ncbi:MAG TPA: lipoprotein-releasing ABC transporter permease subunit [Candidatus Megaira endosymbiont of Hartmannula sinica]|nr:lipoprotein-releasing ABC transporter permease subunit [Candidatus Megaera endosymbiont of Hartmannula sinica]
MFRELILPYIVSKQYLSFNTRDRFTKIVSVISVIGIMIGVATLIIVISIMHGFKDELSKNIKGINGDVNISSLKSRIDNYEDLLDTLNKKLYVQEAVPIISGHAFVSSRYNNSGVFIKSLSKEEFIKKRIFNNNIINGKMADYDNNNSVFIGKDLATSLNVRVGDNIKIISGVTVQSIFGDIPRYKRFKIAAIFKTNIIDYDSSAIFMNINNAQKLFNMKPGEINLIEVSLNNNKPELLDKYSSEIKNIVGKDFFVTSWVDHNFQILNALEVERVAMFLILMMIIIVASFNMLSSLFMLSEDKKYEIAILISYGASRFQIMSIFIIVGFLLGMIGIITGFFLAVVFLYNINSIKNFLEYLFGVQIFDPSIYFLQELPSKIYFYDSFYVILYSIILSLFASLYPAFRASQMNPVDLIRNN